MQQGKPSQKARTCLVFSLLPQCLTFRLLLQAHGWGFSQPPWGAAGTELLRSSPQKQPGYGRRAGAWWWPWQARFSGSPSAPGGAGALLGLGVHHGTFDACIRRGLVPLCLLFFFFFLCFPLLFFPFLGSRSSGEIR